MEVEFTVDRLICAKRRRTRTRLPAAGSSRSARRMGGRRASSTVAKQVGDWPGSALST